MAQLPPALRLVLGLMGTPRSTALGMVSMGAEAFEQPLGGVLCFAAGSFLTHAAPGHAQPLFYHPLPPHSPPNLFLFFHQARREGPPPVRAQFALAPPRSIPLLEEAQLN